MSRRPLCAKGGALEQEKVARKKSYADVHHRDTELTENPLFQDFMSSVPEPALSAAEGW
jgi:hypothetical protein